MILFDNVSFTVIANFAIALALIVAAVLAVVYIIKGWIMAITAWWDAEKLKQWMHAIRYSIVWLVVVFLAVLIIKLIWALVWIDLLWYVNKENIFGMFDLILDRLDWNYQAPSSDAPF